MQDSEPSRSEVQTNRTSITGVSSLPKLVENQQRSVSVKSKWKKEEHKFAVECKLRVELNDHVRGIGKMTLRYWEEMTENKLMDQIRTILGKGWLTLVEVE